MIIDDVSRTITFISSNFPLLIFVLTLTGVMIGKFKYKTSILASLEKIAFEQEKNRREQKQEEFKKSITNRYIELGNSLLNVSNLEVAKTEFENAIKIDPLNTDAQLGLIKSEIFYSTKNGIYNAEVSRKKIELILEEKPSDPHACSFLGDVYNSLFTDEHADIALELYNKAISFDDKIATAYFGIGSINDRRGKLDDALSWYTKAYNLSQWNPFYANSIAYQCLQRKQYKEAVKKYELILRIQGDFIIPYYNISNCYRILGNFEIAHSYLLCLLDLLENNKITSLNYNRGAWFYNVYSENILINNFEEKKCWAYYGMALTNYLLDDNVNTNKYIEQVKLLQIQEVEWIKIIVRYEIDLLINEQPQLKSKLDHYKIDILR